MYDIKSGCTPYDRGDGNAVSLPQNNIVGTRHCRVLFTKAPAEETAMPCPYRCCCSPIGIIYDRIEAFCSAFKSRLLAA
ncbi:hypothetical protein, partial [Microcoleus sp. herbarium14]|uniref:hypothetical protein n=1 Tax=Microcoleus sp. herbarium14 TaxID=3055439 RepID=UPI002FCF2421